MTRCVTGTSAAAEACEADEACAEEAALDPVPTEEAGEPQLNNKQRKKAKALARRKAVRAALRKEQELERERNPPPPPPVPKPLVVEEGATLPERRRARRRRLAIRKAQAAGAIHNAKEVLGVEVVQRLEAEVEARVKASSSGVTLRQRAEMITAAMRTAVRVDAIEAQEQENSEKRPGWLRGEMVAVATRAADEALASSQREGGRVMETGESVPLTTQGEVSSGCEEKRPEGPR